MATTDILLLSPVEGLGNEGEQVTVKAGYARNFLFPQKIALPVNRGNSKYIEALQKRRAAREAKELGGAQAIATRLKTLSIAFPVKTGEGGKMFGAITVNDLLKRFEEEGLAINKKQIALYTPVKTLGKHSTKIKLHKDVKVDFEFEIVSENPIEEVTEG